MSVWKKARKKPITIEFREVNKIERIKTREGELTAYPQRDYIIRGVKGETYPISKEIFEQTYQIIQDNSNDWDINLEIFKEQMESKITENMAEKGLSWRKMEHEELEGLLIIYGQRKKWVSIANIAFMIWENEERSGEA